MTCLFDVDAAGESDALAGVAVGSDAVVVVPEVAGRDGWMMAISFLPREHLIIREQKTDIEVHGKAEHSTYLTCSETNFVVPASSRH